MAAAGVLCWVCGSADVRAWRQGTLTGTVQPDNLRVTDASYGLMWPMHRCRRCRFVFAPAAMSTDLVALYNRMSDPEYVQSQGSRLRQMQWLLRQCRRYHRAGRTLLDVGAATGLLVREALRSGLDAVGVEPSEALASAALDNHANVLHGVLPHPQLHRRQFDFVCLVDVVEHVIDPLQLLRDAKAMLHPQGLLLVVTPDISSVTARVMGSRWWHYRPAHVCFFDRRSMAAASASAALAVQTSFRARWFFEVGYLATRLEQYLPVGWINHTASRTRPLQWAYSRTIPVNLRDSTVFVLRHAVPA